MAVYAVGDIQGCAAAFEQLLDEIRFDPARDRLWLVGDLVARGPASLDVLRRVRDLGEAVVTVLGNHDLSLLAAAVTGRRPKDSTAEVLDAADADELLGWLRRRALLHHDARLGWTMVHAGLPPDWDIATARRRAGEVEQVLRGEGYADLLAAMYGNEPRRWHEDLAGFERLRYTINALTRIRFVAPNGQLDFDHKGPPGTQPAGLQPWFRLAARASAGERLVFGHWSAMGVLLEPDLAGLDSGCVWGGCLTALRLDRDEPPRAVDCRGSARPG